MTPRLFLRKAARADITEAFRWYEERGAGLGREFLRALRVTLAAVERAPEQFAVVLDDIRRAQLPRFPYLVYYVVLPRGISIIAVMHGRRNPQRWHRRR